MERSASEAFAANEEGGIKPLLHMGKGRWKHEAFEAAAPEG